MSSTLLLLLPTLAVNLPSRFPLNMFLIDFSMREPCGILLETKW